MNRPTQPHAPKPCVATWILGSALTCLGAGCQSQEISALDSPGTVEYMISHGDFQLAVEAAAELVASRPGDVRAQRLHQQASVGFLLHRGRLLTFEHRDEEALVEFEHALELDPTSSSAERWVVKTRRKISARWYSIARELHTIDNLEGAIEAYEKALDYDSSLDLAREGAARVVVQLNYRDGLSDEYYNDGVRALNDYRLFVAKSRFVYSGKYDEHDAKPKRRVVEVDRELSAARSAIAANLEAAGLYTAARNEYRGAKILDPKNETAVIGYERNIIEAEALDLLKKGRMSVLRGEWETGQKKLLEGKALTKLQTEAFDEALGTIDEARADSAYERALDYEHDFRFPEAISKYDELLQMRDYYKDARARKNTLEDYVRDAARLYERAESATDMEVRVSLLRQIDVFWPEYLDVQQQLEALEGE